MAQLFARAYRQAQQRLAGVVEGSEASAGTLSGVWVTRHGAAPPQGGRSNRVEREVRGELCKAQAADEELDAGCHKGLGEGSRADIDGPGGGSVRGA